MTKKEALEYFKRPIDIAKALGIGKSAVSQWPDDEDMPELRSLQLEKIIKSKRLKPIYGKG